MTLTFKSFQILKVDHFFPSSIINLPFRWWGKKPTILQSWSVRRTDVWWTMSLQLFLISLWGGPTRRRILHHHQCQDASWTAFQIQSLDLFIICVSVYCKTDRSSDVVKNPCLSLASSNHRGPVPARLALHSAHTGQTWFDQREPLWLMISPYICSDGNLDRLSCCANVSESRKKYDFDHFVWLWSV